MHYQTVSESIWLKLTSRFKYDYCIPRPVIGRGHHGTLPVLRVYPTLFQVFTWTNADTLNHPRALYWEANNPTSTPLILPLYDDTFISNGPDFLNLIWKLFPDVYKAVSADIGEDTHSSIQLCYRSDPNQWWTVLWSPQYKIQATNLTTFIRSLQPRNHLEGIARCHSLLLETRYRSSDEDGSHWRADRFFSDIASNAWRYSLQIGDLIDAQDTQEKWYEARILDIQTSQILVHYRGWTSKWDVWLPCDSPKIGVHHTKVSNWRAFRRGDSIEVGFPQTTRNFPEWKWGKVLRMQEDSVYIELEDGHTCVRPVQDELLCAPGTHKSSNESNWQKPIQNARSLGAVGLQNLGNSCFLNSMLQCLTHAPPLCTYFTTLRAGRLLYQLEINVKNPLGMHGKIATAFAKLLSEMYSGDARVVSPVDLKYVIGQYAPQFAGYAQQDSQEVMNFLLDGLHEDLNRVRQKPQTKMIEGNGQNDVTIAMEAWEQFKRRNDSVIVDHFMGQLRSHVTCSNPICGHESITFDPFMSLSVPIPTSESNEVIAQIFWANGEIPTKYGVNVSKTACVQEMVRALAKLANVSESRLLATELMEDSPRRIRVYDPTQSIKRITRTPVHVYELEDEFQACAFSCQDVTPPTLKEQTTTLPIDSNTSVLKVVVALMHQIPFASPVDGRIADEEDVFGAKQRRIDMEFLNAPLVVTLQRTDSMEQIHHTIWKVVARLISPSSLFGFQHHQELPYQLHCIDLQGTEISDFDTDTLPLLSLHQPFSLVLEWSRHGFHRGYDRISARRVSLHESFRRLSLTEQPEQSPIPVTLMNCIEKFTEREQLGHRDTWYCPKCSQHVRAYKKFDLFSLPNVLIFHLKRFRYAASTSLYLSHQRDKISSLVSFPVDDLNMKECVIDPSQKEFQYELFAVSEHSGGLGGGHYTAVAKVSASGKWYRFNDSFVEETKPENAITSRAYVLFYQRKCDENVTKREAH